MKRLIVNADDFGRSPGVNAGVLESHARGIVTSTTVMVLEPAAARGLREAGERGRKLSVGLHFTLTGGGTPAAEARTVPALAPGGRFRRKREELPPTLPGAEVRLELEAQIALFQVLARRPPSHLDSHHFAALHPSVTPVFGDVAKARALPVRAENETVRRSLRAAGVRTPDRFEGGFYGENVSFAALEEIVRNLPDGTTELMCHPGHADAGLREGSSYVEERGWEVEVLRDAGIRKLLRACRVSLVGFEAL